MAFVKLSLLVLLSVAIVSSAPSPAPAPAPGPFFFGPIGRWDTGENTEQKNLTSFYAASCKSIFVSAWSMPSWGSRRSWWAASSGRSPGTTTWTTTGTITWTTSGTITGTIIGTINRDVYICCKLWKLSSVTANGEGGCHTNFLTQIISISDSAENAFKYPKNSHILISNRYSVLNIIPGQCWGWSKQSWDFWNRWPDVYWKRKISKVGFVEILRCSYTVLPQQGYWGEEETAEGEEAIFFLMQTP